jgi:hypothetical protein
MVSRAVVPATAYNLSVGAVNASGIALPGAVAGWTLVYANDFNTPFSVGAVSSAGDFPSPYSGDLSASIYPDWAPDTAQSLDGANSCYRPSQVLSCSGSCIRKHVFVNTTDIPGTNFPQSATFVVQPGGVGNQLYGRYSVCFRIPTTFNGWKLAWLRWPASNVWPRDGEIDFPEGSLNGNIEAYMHWQGGTSGSNQDGYTPGTPYGNGWHVCTLEWLSTRCTFILDGVTIGNNTTTAHIPNTPMYWALQTETEFAGYPANMPTVTDHGDIEIDWVAMWST